MTEKDEKFCKKCKYQGRTCGHVSCDYLYYTGKSRMKQGIPAGVRCTVFAPLESKKATRDAKEFIVAPKNVRAKRERGKKPYSYDSGVVLGLYQAGLSDSEIAQKIGKSIQTVSRWRSRSNLPANRSRYKVCREKKYADSEFITLHEKGLTNCEISKEIGCNRGLVDMRINQLGLKPNGKIPPIPKQELIRLHGLGLTDKEIAAELGYSEKGVYNCRYKLGLKSNRRRK